MSKTKTIFYPEILDSKTAEVAYDFIKNNTLWVDSVYSKKAKKITRKGYTVNLDLSTLDVIDEFIIGIVENILINIEKKDGAKSNYGILGIYVNYYQDGKSFCPNHSHPGTTQLVLSLGTTRKFILGKKEYNVKAGDAIIFGSSIHGIPEQPEITDSRVSIAIFLKKD